jgi:hypothetical protein
VPQVRQRAALNAGERPAKVLWERSGDGHDRTRIV